MKLFRNVLSKLPLNSLRSELAILNEFKNVHNEYLCVLTNETMTNKSMTNSKFNICSLYPSY